MDKDELIDQIYEFLSQAEYEDDDVFRTGVDIAAQIEELIADRDTINLSIDSIDSIFDLLAVLDELSEIERELFSTDIDNYGRGNYDYEIHLKDGSIVSGSVMIYKENPTEKDILDVILAVNGDIDSDGISAVYAY